MICRISLEKGSFPKCGSPEVRRGRQAFQDKKQLPQSQLQDPIYLYREDVILRGNRQAVHDTPAYFHTVFGYRLIKNKYFEVLRST
jgi:hypothetical protein